MALVLRGRVYYVYYRDERGVLASRSLRTTSRVLAKHLHDAFMAARAARKEVLALHRRFPDRVPAVVEELAPMPEPVRRRMRIADMLTELGKISPVSTARRRAVQRFQRTIRAQYVDEVTPSMALAYLERISKGDKNTKQFNNNRSALNKCFALLAVSAGIERSPFAAIPSRKVENVTHHRPLTDAEFRLLMDAAEEPYRTAAALGFYCGMDLSTACALPGHAVDLQQRLIRWKRPKTGTWFTAGIHPDLLPLLAALDFDPTSAYPILPITSIHTARKAFHRLFIRLGIFSTDEGKATFHSLRASFFTRCDAAGVHRRATNLAGAHKSDAMTDLYSADTSAAHEIESLPSVL